MKLNVSTTSIINMLTALLLCGFYVFDMSSMGSMVLLGGTLLILAVYSWGHHCKLHISVDAFHINIFGLIAFCLCSSIWSLSVSLSIENAVTLIELLICMSILYMNYTEYDSIEDLYFVIMLAGALVSLYTLYIYGLGTIISTISMGGRLSLKFANINAIAMISSMCIVVYTYRTLYRKNSLFQLVFFGVASFCALIVIAATGSRKALITLVVSVLCIILRKYKSRRLINTIFKWVIILGLSVIALQYLSSFSLFDGINERMKGLIALITGKGTVDVSAQVRKEYVTLGLVAFKHHPIFGIGMGASGAYLSSITGVNEYFHNNYIELLACGGIVGTCIYYNIWLFPLFRLFKLRNIGNEAVFLSIILIVVFLVMDYGMVTYVSKITYFYLMVFYTQIQTMKFSDGLCEERIDSQ